MEEKKDVSPYDKDHLYSKVNISVRALDVIIVCGIVALAVIVLMMS